MVCAELTAKEKKKYFFYTPCIGHSTKKGSECETVNEENNSLRAGTKKKVITKKVKKQRCLWVSVHACALQGLSLKTVFLQLYIFLCSCNEKGVLLKWIENYREVLDIHPHAKRNSGKIKNYSAQFLKCLQTLINVQRYSLKVY